MQTALLFVSHLLLAYSSTDGDPIDAKYPLGSQLRVLAADADSPKYRQLVTQEMLATDLAAANDLGSPILVSPAVFDDQLFLRTQDEVVCIEPSAGN